jgi:hypothetical protein
MRKAVCSFVGAEVSVNDFRVAARTRHDGRRDVFDWKVSVQIPAHAAPSALLGRPDCFSKKRTARFSARILFHQLGDVDPLTDKSVIERTRQTFP